MKFKIYTVLVSLLICVPLCNGQTIEEYVKISNEDMLWGNCVSGLMNPVEDLKDYQKIFNNAFENMSYSEGKPVIADITVFECKSVEIHNTKYFLIRYNWRQTERILIINMDTKLDGQWKGRWSVR